MSIAKVDSVKDIGSLRNSAFNILRNVQVQSPPNDLPLNGDSAGKAFSPPADWLSGAASPYEQFKLCVMRYDSASRQVTTRTARLPNVSTHNA